MATLTISKEDEKRVKAMGFLSNKGTDNFSARIITVNGKITAAQQRCIAEAAEKFGNGVITFTTRLTVEVQGVPYDKIEEFKEYIESGQAKYIVENGENNIYNENDGTDNDLDYIIDEKYEEIGRNDSFVLMKRK